MSEPSTLPAQTTAQAAEIQRIFSLQQAHHWEVARTGARQRRQKLKRLHDCILRHRDDIKAAMWQDFRKGPTEVDISEVGVVTKELRHAMRHLSDWMRPRSVGTPLALIGTRSEIRYEPKGVCLIISPWNFPFNLTLTPLASAVAAGNCVMLKPSEFTPASSALLKKIIGECFPPEEVCLFEGEVSTAQALLALPFNHIFFTGSPNVGKIVMKAAAEHLSSITLELGGKSPVIVDESADLDTAAAKILWLKAMNSGQTCIAPDYVLVQEQVHDALVEKLGEKARAFYGDAPEARRQSPDYCRLVSDKHFGRVRGLLDEAFADGAHIAHGGNLDAAERYCEPTVLTRVPDNSRIWEEEIFGPLLPVRPYRTLDEAISYINAKPQPLAMYIFSAKRRNIRQILAETRNGDVTVNDCATHFYNPELPFGGVNNSGIGKSHGKFGFLEFSNARGVNYQNRLLPHTNFFLPPYGSRFSRWLLEGVVKWF